MEGTYEEALGSDTDGNYDADDADNMSDRDEENDQNDDTRTGDHFTEMWKVDGHMKNPIPPCLLNGLKEAMVGSCTLKVQGEVIEISGDSKDSLGRMISVLEGVRSMIVRTRLQY